MIGKLPEGPLREFWDDVLDDLEATAEEYDEAGWTTVTVDPGDVAFRSEDAFDRFGIELVLGDEEAAAVAEHVTAPDASFDTCSVFQAPVEDVVFLVVVVEDPGREVAILYPAFYDTTSEDVQATLDLARERREMHTHLRDLGEEHLLTFTHDDVSLFLPEEEA